MRSAVLASVAVLAIGAVATLAAPPEITPATPPDGEGLDRRIDTARFDATPVAVAVATAAGTAGMKIDVDWPVLAKLKITPDTPVTARLKNVSAKKIVRVLFDALPGQADASTADKIVLMETPGGLRATTYREGLGRFTETKSYPIGDLFDRPDRTPDQQALLKRTASTTSPQCRNDGHLGHQPGDWSGLIEFEGRDLRVTHTPDVHRQIEEMLADLRGQQIVATQPATQPSTNVDR